MSTESWLWNIIEKASVEVSTAKTPEVSASKTPGTFIDPDSRSIEAVVTPEPEPQSDHPNNAEEARNQEPNVKSQLKYLVYLLLSLVALLVVIVVVLAVLLSKDDSPCQQDIPDLSTSKSTCQMPENTTQAPTTPAPCNSNGARADIHFLLDESGSVRPRNFDKTKEFVKSFVKDYDISPNSVQIGVSTFSNYVRKAFWMNEYHSKDALLNAINRISYHDGSTQTDLALKHAREQAFTEANGDRDGVPNALVVLTDGESNDGDSTRLEASKLHKLHINVFVVGVGRGVDKTELNNIASESGNVFIVTDFDALKMIKKQLGDAACQGDGEMPASAVGTRARALHIAVVVISGYLVY